MVTVKKSSALTELKAHQHVNKSSPLTCILGKINRVSTVHSYFLNFCFDFILPSMFRPTKWSHSLRFFHQNSVCIFRFSHNTSWARKLYNDLYNLYSSSDVIRMIKCTKIRQTGHIARMGGLTNSYIIVWGNLGNLKTRWYFGDLGLNRMIRKHILQKYGVRRC